MVGVKVRVAVAVCVAVGECAGNVKVARSVWVVIKVPVEVGVVAFFPPAALRSMTSPNR
jgi:hypothetical protein